MIKTVKPMVTVESSFVGIMQILEKAGRICYKSEDKITDNSAELFIRRIIKVGHESVLEHASVSVKIICSRACSHQLVRHRIAAYSQESQRYCAYTKDEALKVICPPSLHFNQEWLDHIEKAHKYYCKLIEKGIRPEDARFILPNATATTIFTTFNLRQWRHVLKQRALNSKVQWEIRCIFLDLLTIFVEHLPAVFEDLLEKP